MQMARAQAQYKDRLFSFIFGSEEHKDWTLSLYNAVNGSSYDNPDSSPSRRSGTRSIWVCTTTYRSSSQTR